MTGPTPSDTVSRTARPYRVEDSGRSRAEISSFLHDQHYRGYGSDYRHGGTGKVVVGCLYDFERLIAHLAGLPHVEFVHHVDLLAEPGPPDRIRVGIRHDVDTDIDAGLVQAEIEHAHGVVANWVILHTAWYYGTMEDGVFRRNESMADVYRRFQDLGHEVSLHTDPLLLYQDYGVDGAEAVVTELAWLRSLGLNVRGTTAHNHRPRYGAVNYEVFKGYAAPSDETNRTEVVHDGKWAPLRVLDPADLGLVYEGNEVFWQRHTPLEYGAARFANQWRWNRHLAHRRAHPTAPELPFTDEQRLMAEIAELPLGSWLVLVVHPAYYGNRPSAVEPPPRRLNRTSVVHSAEFGWYTWEPNTTQAWSGPETMPQTFQVINTANGAGMLDLPWPESKPRTSIVLLGGTNADGLSVPVPVQVQTRLTDLLREHRPEMDAHVAKLAFPGMGVSRLWAWLDAAWDRLAPDVVILPVGADVVTVNTPEVWSAEVGGKPHRPPGDVLVWEPKNDRVTRRRAARRSPGPDGAHARALAGASERRDDPSLDAAEARAFIGALYRHVADAVRARGAGVLLFVEAADPRAAGADGTLDAFVAELAASIGAPVVDPYPRIRANAERLPAHHPGDTRWGPTAHRLGAEALFEYFGTT